MFDDSNGDFLAIGLAVFGIVCVVVAVGVAVASRLI